MKVHFVNIEYRKVQYKLHVVFNDEPQSNTATLYRIVNGTSGFSLVGAASFLCDGEAVLISYADPEFPTAGTKLFEEIVSNLTRLASES